MIFSKRRIIVLGEVWSRFVALLVGNYLIILGFYSHSSVSSAALTRVITSFLCLDCHFGGEFGGA